MTSERDDARLAQAFRSIEGSAVGEVDAEIVWKAAAGELPAEERRRIIDKVATDPDYAEAWRLAMELVRVARGADLVETGPLGAEVSPPLWRSPYVLAAAAIFLVGLLGVIVPSLLSPPEPQYRGGTIEALVASEQRLAREDFRLRWDAPEGARFDLRVTTEALSSIDAASGLETTEYVVPAERLASLPSGTRILWQIDATLADGTFVRSDTFIAEIE